MKHPIAAPFIWSLTVVFSVAIIAPPAGAASIPAYTVTDLGVDTGYTLSNTGATGTVTTSTGAVYAFPRTDNLVTNPQSLLATFPPFTNAPIQASMNLGGPTFAYSNFDYSDVFLNKAGEFAATDLVGVAAHIDGAGSTVYTATQQSDGTFGPLKALWSTPNNVYSSGTIAQVLDLNNAGQILGVNAGNGSYGSRSFFVYDLRSGLKTDLASLLPSGYSLDYREEIDDQGRILIQATKPYVPGQLNPTEDLLLLSPAGLSSNPIPAPEPSTLAILAVAGLGLAARRRWKS